jgi:hypothetical protein
MHQWKTEKVIYEVDCAVETCVFVCSRNSNYMQKDDIKALEQAESLPENFAVVIGKPKCAEMYEEDDHWKFESVIALW